MKFLHKRSIVVVQMNNGIVTKQFLSVEKQNVVRRYLELDYVARDRWLMRPHNSQWIVVVGPESWKREHTQHNDGAINYGRWEILLKTIPPLK